MLALLAEMAFGGGDGFLKVFGDQGGGEPWPRGEVSSLDCFEPGGFDRAEAGSV